MRPVEAMPLESRQHRDFTAGKPVFDLGGVNVTNSGAGMGVVGFDRQLPSQPRPGHQSLRLERQCHQAGGDLLAGGDDGVVLARVHHAADLARPVVQLIRRPSHCRYHHRGFVTGLKGLDDAGRDPPHVGHVRNGGSAELEDDACHLRRTRRVPRIPRSGPVLSWRRPSPHAGPHLQKMA